MTNNELNKNAFRIYNFLLFKIINIINKYNGRGSDPEKKSRKLHPFKSAWPGPVWLSFQSLQRRQQERNLCHKMRSKIETKRKSNA